MSVHSEILEMLAKDCLSKARAFDRMAKAAQNRSEGLSQKETIRIATMGAEAQTRRASLERELARKYAAAVKEMEETVPC